MCAYTYTPHIYTHTPHICTHTHRNLSLKLIYFHHSPLLFFPGYPSGLSVSVVWFYFFFNICQDGSPHLCAEDSVRHSEPQEPTVTSVSLSLSYSSSRLRVLNPFPSLTSPGSHLLSFLPTSFSFSSATGCSSSMCPPHMSSIFQCPSHISRISVIGTQTFPVLSLLPSWGFPF